MMNYRLPEIFPLLPSHPGTRMASRSKEDWEWGQAKAWSRGLPPPAPPEIHQMAVLGMGGRHEHGAGGSRPPHPRKYTKWQYLPPAPPRVCLAALLVSG